MLTLKKAKPAEAAWLWDILIVDVALHIARISFDRMSTEIQPITFTTTAIAVMSIPTAPNYYLGHCMGQWINL